MNKSWRWLACWIPFYWAVCLLDGMWVIHQSRLMETESLWCLMICCRAICLLTVWERCHIVSQRWLWGDDARGMVVRTFNKTQTFAAAFSACQTNSAKPSGVSWRETKWKQEMRNQHLCGAASGLQKTHAALTAFIWFSLAVRVPWIIQQELC